MGFSGYWNSSTYISWRQILGPSMASYCFWYLPLLFPLFPFPNINTSIIPIINSNNDSNENSSNHPQELFLPLASLTFQHHGETVGSIVPNLERNKSRSHVYIIFPGSQKAPHRSSGATLSAVTEVTLHWCQTTLLIFNIPSMFQALGHFLSQQCSLSYNHEEVLLDVLPSLFLVFHLCPQL